MLQQCQWDTAPSHSREPKSRITETKRDNYLLADLHIKNTETELITNSITVKQNYPDLLSMCRE